MSMLLAETVVPPLTLLGFKSESKYFTSKLFRAVRPLVLADRKAHCEFKICRSFHDKPATDLVFVHKVLPAYLGIGPSNLAAVCSDCKDVSETWDSGAVFFAVSGLRKRSGYSRPNIGFWYRDRIKANQTLARAVLDALGERNRGFVVSLIERDLLPAFYREYLRLTDVALSDQGTTG